jgi:hypothetical protein
LIFSLTEVAAATAALAAGAAAEQRVPAALTRRDIQTERVAAPVATAERAVTAAAVRRAAELALSSSKSQMKIASY